MSGDGVLTISEQGDEMAMDLPEGVLSVLLKTGTEGHITSMTLAPHNSVHASGTMQTMSNLKLNEVGPIEARSAGRILDGPFPGSSK